MASSALGVSLLLTACSSVRYLAHLGSGQLSTLLARQRLTDERIATLTDTERRGLETLGRARSFAASLGLAESTSYRHLIDRQGRSALTVVTAAEPDRLVPRSWWFPIAGRVSYRGYFDPEKAEHFAGELADQGYDTYMRGATLYSTLGWFDDPLPRAMLSWPSFELAYVVLHELVHETVYVPGDVDYNEALATFIGHRATLELVAEDAEQTRLAEQSFADDLEFAALLAALTEELETVYGQAPDAEAARAERGPVFERYQRTHFAEREWRTRRYARFPELELNNAYLLANQSYVRDLPCFERELDSLAGDLRAFIALHRAEPGRHQSDCTSRDVPG